MQSLFYVQCKYYSRYKQFESWGLRQEFVKFLWKLWYFLVASFFLLAANFKRILAASLNKTCGKSEKSMFYMWKNMFFPTCTKFYSGLRQEFVKCLWPAGKNLPQENFRVAARIWQILDTSLNFLQHTQIFLWVYSHFFNKSLSLIEYETKVRAAKIQSQKIRTG